MEKDKFNRKCAYVHICTAVQINSEPFEKLSLNVILISSHINKQHIFPIYFAQYAVSWKAALSHLRLSSSHGSEYADSGLLSCDAMMFQRKSNLRMKVKVFL